jgi:formamidopyrimidine-DNA glycosylase
MVRGIRPHVEGRVLRRLEACPNTCRPLAMTPRMDLQVEQSRGKQIIGIKRRAKRIVLQLDDGFAFVIEPRMTGLLLLADPPDREHLRLVWRFEPAAGQGDLWFWDRRGLGTVSLFSPAQLERNLGPGKLGTDALEMSTEMWLSFCRSTSRAIKVALLDQVKVAGIGNLYASEILHVCGIDPRRRASGLTRREIQGLGEATRMVLLEAIQYEGSTLSDGTYRNALNRAGGYQNQHRVYDRAGESCPRCGGIIRRIVQAQRATFFCDQCQRRPHRRKS